MLLRVALWGPLLIAALLAGTYIYLHDPFARDGTQVLPVPLSEEDPQLDRVGDLKYLGGLDIPRMGQNIGGLSGLRWNADTARLLAITDDARWVWITPEEQGDTLTGIAALKAGAFLGLGGETLSGKEQGDSESLTRSARGGWLIGFERDHRLWRYESLTDPALETAIYPLTLLEPLEANAGLEALAGDEARLLTCVERAADIGAGNCIEQFEGTDVMASRRITPPAAIADRGAVPTDADALSDGTFLILFRSYSPAKGNTAAIVAYAPDGTRREIATFVPPLTLDNFEGLAVREEGPEDERRTFLYIVSDDNFSGSQRTLLMKFELLESGSG